LKPSSIPGYLLICAVFVATTVFAADRYPSKPVRVVVPYAPGGGSDIIARLMGLKLGEALGESFVVDNRPGAGSQVATELVARSAGDGYTLILADVPLTINVSTYARPTYDAVKDFAPIMMVGITPQIMVAHASFAPNSLKEVLAMPRAQTEKIALGTGGTGSSPHMTYELLRLRTGLVLNHVPYKGGGPATTDVLAGQIPTALNGAPSAMTYLRSNQLKGLGITSAKRHPLVPNIPTFEEAGVPDFIVYHWYGMLAPAGTPPAVIKSLYAEIQKALQMPDVTKRFTELAINVASAGPDEFAKIIEADVRRWREVVKNSGIRIE
jgi:tripartite-type tricarboxylate transporter receptor subunit TctC